jgi:hypothetical protein
MQQIQKLWLWLTIIGPLHMTEQLMMGIDEYFSIKDLMGGYYAWFAPTDTDWATVVFITIVWTFISVLFYGLLRGGRALLTVVALFAFFAVQEIHHVIEAVGKMAYDPGLITCVPYGYVGGLMAIAAWRESQSPRGVRGGQRIAAV